MTKRSSRSKRLRKRKYPNKRIDAKERQIHSHIYYENSSYMMQPA
jgi:hypothetical protein